MSKSQRTSPSCEALVPEENVDFHHELTQGFAARYIRRKARELARQPGFKGTEKDDLRQQLYLRILERLPQFDPSQGCFNAFVKLIVRQFATDCRRHMSAQMRDRRSDVSLSSLVAGEEGPVELAQTIGRRELNARLHRDEQDTEATSDLAQDLAAFLASLPPRLCTIAERLKDASPTQIASELGVHFTTVYRDMRRMREQFAKAGFGEYLPAMQRPRSRRRSSPGSDTAIGETKHSEPAQPSAMPNSPQSADSCVANEAAAGPQPEAMDVRFLLREPAEDYHAKAGGYLTSHLLADFRRCPLLYHRKRRGLVPLGENCPAFLVGSAAHTVILEGDEAFRQRFAVGGPVNPKTGLPFGAGTKARTEWAEANRKEVLTEEQFTLVTNMAVSVRQHTGASQLLAAGEAECVVRADYMGLPCQIRMDWFEPHTGIVDLKTCDDLAWFESDARRYGYLYQLAFYRAVLAQVIGLYVPCHLIAVEKKEPFRSGVWRLSPEVLATAQKENEMAIDRLQGCLANDHWPSGYEEPRLFDFL